MTRWPRLLAFAQAPFGFACTGPACLSEKTSCAAGCHSTKVGLVRRRAGMSHYGLHVAKHCSPNYRITLTSNWTIHFVRSWSDTWMDAALVRRLSPLWKRRSSNVGTRPETALHPKLRECAKS